MGSIEEYLARFSDQRLAKLEQLERDLKDFNPESDDSDELLSYVLPQEAYHDEEIQHYVKALRKALSRWEQKQLGAWEPDEMLAYHAKRALMEGD